MAFLISVLLHHLPQIEHLQIYASHFHRRFISNVEVHLLIKFVVETVDETCVTSFEIDASLNISNQVVCNCNMYKYIRVVHLEIFQAHIP